MPLKETTIESVQNETPNIPEVGKDELHAWIKCEQCGFYSKSYCGLRSYKKKTPYNFTTECGFKQKEIFPANHICN